ncbi:MAG: hypothetical protein ABIR18_06490 [Chitinophagaceae bacterium]
MKKFLLIFLNSLLCSAVVAQVDSTNFEKLLAQFSNISSIGAEPHIAKLYKTTRFVLQFGNPLFNATTTEFTYLFKQKKGEALLVKLGDSLYNNFSRNYFLLQQNQSSQFQKIFSLYTEKLCPCLTAKLASDPQLKDIFIIASECEKILLSDNQFIVSLAAEISKIPEGERSALQAYGEKYSYFNCRPYNKAVNDAFIDQVIFNYHEYMQDLSNNLESKIVKLYQQNKRDSLLLIFPDYNTYKKSIENSAVATKSNGPTTTKIKNNGANANIKTYTTTYYVDGKIPTITGQVIYTCSFDDVNLKVTSYLYLSPDKIKDKARILKELNEMPPLQSPMLPMN